MHFRFSIMLFREYQRAPNATAVQIEVDFMIGSIELNYHSAGFFQIGIHIFQSPVFWTLPKGPIFLLLTPDSS